ncbi:MAG: hypothetical protein KDJ48_02065 [Nitratireductor sp.]|nr:hypothetical protein [Nitratireductor sp.]MCB1454892.1 hypothetical protein [Nitratireductor sp.]MCB1458053.1 hypothetical protein [Nitratireductor sp.]
MVFSRDLRPATKLATAALAASLALAMPGSAFAKTYLVNGILSATAIGYGFKNLKKKIPGASLFLMVTGIEAGSIRQTIVKDIRKRHAADPSEQFTLAGISAGANVVLQVAQDVARDGIPIHYLAIVEGDGGSLPANVSKADNFICAQRGALCNMKSVAGANTIRVNTGHIDMGNSPEVHNRVVANAR